MMIKIITFNVRGLNDPKKVDRLRNFFQNSQRGVDVIFLQEHKLRDTKAANLGRTLFPRRKCWVSEADPGYNVDGQEGAGKGGICTLLHEKLAPLVSSYGSILHNRAFWFRLKGLPGGDLGILNIYAPNDSRERTLLWQELSARLPSDCRWIVSGDFNMVESAQDKSTLCGKLIPQRERLVWEAFKASFQLSDTFSHTGKLHFSWDNRRRDGCRILGRLDRHYVSSSPGSSFHLSTRNYLILGDSTTSDHLPVSIEVVLQDVGKRHSSYKMNTSYLQHAEVIAAVQRIWTGARSATSDFFSRLRKFSRFYRAFSIKQVKEARRKEADVRGALSAAQEALQADPQCASAQLSLAQNQARLLTFETRKLEGKRLRARLNWKVKGDSMTKEFFNAVKDKPPRTNITELSIPGGSSITSQADIEESCIAFYKELYTAPVSDARSKECEQEILGTLLPCITPLMSFALSQPLSEPELHAAACALAKDKAPGPDGIAINFFTSFWQIIGVDFHQMVLNSLCSGRFPPGVTSGLITLIPKGGDLKQLTNWRPITLLNVSYKIYAKALQLRLQEPLAEIVSPDQSAYLRNRFILDNILLTHETISWARKSQQESIFLKLDFSKAFDRVNWQFLFNAMSRMGFPQLFTNMVKLTMVEAEAAINVNGYTSASFKIDRGVRQGCPLAPFLFLIVGEVLHARTLSAQQQGALKGVKLPKSDAHQLILQFADDTSFTLRAEHDSVSTLVNILHSFSLASGLTINWAKSGAY